MAPRKKAKAKDENEMLEDGYLGLRLDGNVWIISKEKGVVTETPLEGELVLQIIVNALERAVPAYAEELSGKPKKKKK